MHDNPFGHVHAQLGVADEGLLKLELTMQPRDSCETLKVRRAGRPDTDMNASGTSAASATPRYGLKRGSLGEIP